MTVAASILNAFSKPFEVERYLLPVTYFEGEPVQPAPQVQSWSGSVQQLTPNELESLSEGERTKEVLKIYTANNLKTAEGQVPADRVIWGGDKWKVIKITKFKMGTVDHCKAIVQRITEV